MSNPTIKDELKKLISDGATDIKKVYRKSIDEMLKGETERKVCTHISAYECKECGQCMLCSGCDCTGYYEVTKESKDYWKGKTTAIGEEISKLFVDREDDEEELTRSTKEPQREEKRIKLTDMKPLYTLGHTEVSELINKDKKVEEEQTEPQKPEIQTLKIETDTNTYYVDSEHYTTYLTIFAVDIDELIEYMGDTRKEREEFYIKIQDPEFQSDVRNYLFPGLLDISIFTKGHPQIVNEYIRQEYKFDKIEEIKKVSYGIDIELEVGNNLGEYLQEKFLEEVRGEAGTKRYRLLENAVTKRINISSYEKYIRKRVYEHELNR